VTGTLVISMSKRSTVVFLLTCLLPFSIASAASAAKGLSGTYAFTVVGTATVSVGSGSGSPSPVNIFGSLVVDANGSFSGLANVNIGSFQCFAQGPGGGSTTVSGTYTVFGTGPNGAYAVGNGSITTGPAPAACSALSFTGVTGSGSGGGGIVLMADPNGNGLDLSLEDGSGTIGTSTVSALTAFGRAVRITSTSNGFPGGEEP
jgi:hypothetical protein